MKCDYDKDKWHSANERAALRAKAYRDLDGPQVRNILDWLNIDYDKFRKPVLSTRPPYSHSRAKDEDPRPGQGEIYLWAAVLRLLWMDLWPHSEAAMEAARRRGHLVPTRERDRPRSRRGRNGK